MDARHGEPRDRHQRRIGRSARGLQAVPELHAQCRVPRLRAPEFRQGDQRAAQGAQGQRQARVLRARRGFLPESRFGFFFVAFVG